MSTEQWEDYLAANDARFVDELSDFLTYASISSLPEHTGAVADAAQWVADRLTQAGIEVAPESAMGKHKNQSKSNKKQQKHGDSFQHKKQKKGKESGGKTDEEESDGFEEIAANEYQDVSPQQYMQYS